MQRTSLNFCFYGIGVRVESDSHEIVERLGRDFSQYLEPADFTKIIKLEAQLQELPSSFLPRKEATRTTNKVIYYDIDRTRFCDYHGEAYSRFDFATEEAVIISPTVNRLHEICYLLILSRVGKWLDLKGLHRFHACGFTLGERAVLLTMPMGGGKSTLFTKMALNYPQEVKIYSDDSVLIDSKGSVHAMALRVGLPPEFAAEFSGRTYELERRFFGRKILLPLEELGLPVAEELKAHKIALLFGTRTQANAPKLYRIGKLEALVRLISPMVIGVGLAMIFEYFWENGLSDFKIKSKIALKRLWAAGVLAYRAENWRIELGVNKDANSSFIREKFKA